MNRRTLIKNISCVAALGRMRASAQSAGQRSSGLPLEQFEPKSMLHTAHTQVLKSRYPVIDFHTHITWSGELSGADKVTFNQSPGEILPVMDRKNIRVMVDVTGGYGNGLRNAIGTLSKPHPNRFVVFTEPWWSKITEPDYPKFQAGQIEVARKAGARGLKVLKILGLYLREHVTSGKLIAVDDRRFDPMWDTAGALRMPIAIHTSDPEAFFLPIDRFNERWEELHAHPEWSFYGKDYPSNRELQEARRRVMRRHPRTTFVCLHVADAEDLPYVTECMESHPNMMVEIGARIGELGRQPRAARKFFDRFQDRIVFGTDAVPKGEEYPQQVFNDALYEIYYRFLETEDEYFDYAPARVPPQGRWRIYGLRLPDAILKKVYWQNAARILGLET
jgi:predicted TIM-barrel fold metal-dependent hydrolase